MDEELKNAIETIENYMLNPAGFPEHILGALFVILDAAKDQLDSGQNFFEEF